MAKPHKLKDGRYECQNCLGKFTKKPQTYIDPLFCSDPCRKEFHAQGGMSLKRLETKVRAWVRDELLQGSQFTAPQSAAVSQRKGGIRFSFLIVLMGILFGSSVAWFSWKYGPDTRKMVWPVLTDAGSQLTGRGK